VWRSRGARSQPTYLAFLDQVLRERIDAKQRKRVAMHVQIAHFPAVKTLEELDFRFQPSIDQKLARELATGYFIANAENLLVFGPPGVGKTHRAIAIGRAVIEAGHPVLFARPKLLIVDELGYLPFEKRSAPLFFQLVARRYEHGSMLVTTNQVVSPWGIVVVGDVLAAAIFDRLLHHSLALIEAQGRPTGTTGEVHLTRRDGVRFRVVWGSVLPVV
jgi:DNA replication protein DnaC